MEEVVFAKEECIYFQIQMPIPNAATSAVTTAITHLRAENFAGWCWFLVLAQFFIGTPKDWNAEWETEDVGQDPK